MRLSDQKQSFLSILGKRNHRMQQSLQQVMPPTVHGAVSTMLGVAMLAFSEFDFIVQ
jgi:patched 1 protein